MLTLDEIHQKIESCNERMEELVTEITAAAGDAAFTETTFKVRFAQERLKARSTATSKITTDVAEDTATVATEGERRGYLIGANNLTVLREALRANQSIMDGLRTQAASYRAAGG